LPARRSDLGALRLTVVFLPGLSANSLAARFLAAAGYAATAIAARRDIARYLDNADGGHPRPICGANYCAWRRKSARRQPFRDRRADFRQGMTKIA